MPTSYSPKGTEIRPYKLAEADLLAIGRLVRACAEIEDIINLHLYQLADITEGTGMVLLGRLPTSARLRIVETFSKARGGRMLELYRQAFDSDGYRDVIKCRSTVTHGYLLGLTDDDEIAFQVQEPVGVDGSKLQTAVNSYSADDIELVAQIAEGVIPQLENAFGLTSSREKRRSQALSPHMKAQPSRMRKAAPSSPPHPSEE